MDMSLPAQVFSYLSKFHKWIFASAPPLAIFRLALSWDIVDCG
jgi:hypothetical protein